MSRSQTIIKGSQGSNSWQELEDKAIEDCHLLSHVFLPSHHVPSGPPPSQNGTTHNALDPSTVVSNHNNTPTDMPI